MQILLAGKLVSESIRDGKMKIAFCLWKRIEEKEEITVKISQTILMENERRGKKRERESGGLRANKDSLCRETGGYFSNGDRKELRFRLFFWYFFFLLEIFFSHTLAKWRFQISFFSSPFSFLVLVFLVPPHCLPTWAIKIREKMVLLWFKDVG